MNFSSFSNFEVKCPVPPIIFFLAQRGIHRSKNWEKSSLPSGSVDSIMGYIGVCWEKLPWNSPVYSQIPEYGLQGMSHCWAALGPLYRNLTISQCKRNKQRSLFYQASFLFSSTTGIEVPQITKEQVRTAISACQLGESPRDAVDQRSLIKKQ